jgi:hypothetical protein
MVLNPIDPARGAFSPAVPGVEAARVGIAARLQQLRAAALRHDRAAVQEQIPEFAALDRSHSSPFHLYNMDEHTFILLDRLVADPAVGARVSEAIVVAALLHDIGKPNVAASSAKNPGVLQFIKHDVVGADEVAPPILERLGISGQERDQIDALIRFHMRPVDLLGQLASGQLQDKTIRGFINDVLVPLERTGLDLQMLLAFARADLIASRGEECCRRYGVAPGDEQAFVARMDQLVGELSARITAVRAQLAAAAAAPPPVAPLVTGSDLNGVFRPGKHFGEILRTARELQSSQPNLDRAGIIAELRGRYPQHLI